MIFNLNVYENAYYTYRTKMINTETMKWAIISVILFAALCIIVKLTFLIYIDSPMIHESHACYYCLKNRRLVYPLHNPNAIDHITFTTINPTEENEYLEEIQ